MADKNFALLSKMTSHALRHAPWLYELELDDDGWVPINDLLCAFRQELVDWPNLSEADFITMIALSEKKRHEICDDKIRALYGHSVQKKFSMPPTLPPEFLYHGTSPDAITFIEKNGLKPMSRQYVHLSSDVGTALEVGKRKAKMPILLKINAQTAAECGIVFFQRNEQVWLTDFVPPQFIINGL